MPEEWDWKTKYKAAFNDMIEQRILMMKFLLDHYGIEVVEDFFSRQDPEWIISLKLGKVKKIFVAMVSKLAPKQIMEKISDACMEQAQYFLNLKQVSVIEETDTSKSVQISKCSPLKYFRKVIKKLKFNDLKDRYVCDFACLPLMRHTVSIANCIISNVYEKDGCILTISIKEKIKNKELL